MTLDDGPVTAALPDGSTMTWEAEAAPRVDEPFDLVFRVTDPSGEPAALEPYMGMLSHAAVARDDGSVLQVKRAEPLTAAFRVRVRP